MTDNEMTEAMRRERPPFGLGFVGSKEGYARNVNAETRTFDFYTRNDYLIEENVSWDRFSHYYAANH